MMKVHYERYLGAENWARMTGCNIPEALLDLYGGEDLSLPERNPEHAVRFERKREWNRRRREAVGSFIHHRFAFVDMGAVANG